MKPILYAILFIAVFTACGQIYSQPPGIPVGQSKSTASQNEAVAYFGEGCFWHSEIVFQSLDGVRDAVSGYSGGTDEHPEYEKVCTGVTGHAEAVQVFYDPAKISYKTLVQAFFASQDPTELNRQGNDVGTQYRSVAFYTSNIQKKIIEEEIRNLTASGKYSAKIVTEVVPFRKFYAAEDYHQEYISHHPGNSYVMNVSIPDFMRFKNEFKAKYKE